MSSLLAFALGTPEIFIIFFGLILIPLPLFIAYKVGFNQGKRKGKLEATQEFNRQHP